MKAARSRATRSRATQRSTASKGRNVVAEAEAEAAAAAGPPRDAQLPRLVPSSPTPKAKKAGSLSNRYASPPFSTLQRPASNLCACHQAPPPTSPPYDHLRSRRSNKIRKWYRTAGTVLVVLGDRGDHVRARFNKQDMVVELSVRRSRNATWQPESVEKEVFQQLNEAGLRMEPVGGWGFLDFVKNAVSVLPCLSVGPARHVC